MNKSEHVWLPTGTDVTVRWRAMGWVPPSEDPSYQAKWRYFQELPLRSLDDVGKKEYENILKRNRVARIK